MNYIKRYRLIVIVACLFGMLVGCVLLDSPSVVPGNITVESVIEKAKDKFYPPGVEKKEKGIELEYSVTTINSANDIKNVKLVKLYIEKPNKYKYISITRHMSSSFSIGQ